MVRLMCNQDTTVRMRLLGYHRGEKVSVSLAGLVLVVLVMAQFLVSDLNVLVWFHL